MKLKGEAVRKGRAEGKALVTKDPLSFLGGVNAETGVVIESGHELEGKKLKNKILVFPHGKGSTVGSYVIYQLVLNNKAPAAMINVNTEPIVATGAIIADIPLVHKLNKNPIEVIKNEDFVTIRNGNVEVNR